MTDEIKENGCLRAEVENYSHTNGNKSLIIRLLTFPESPLVTYLNVQCNLDSLVLLNFVKFTHSVTVEDPYNTLLDNNNNIYAGGMAANSIASLYVRGNC